MFMDPARMLAACNIQVTDTVADFGAGSGFMARALADIATQGNVFAIEINRDLLARVIHEIQEKQIKNIQPLWGDIEIPGGSKLADRSVDMVVMSNVLFQLDDKVGCIKEANRVLKPGGRVLIVDWTESFGGLGPAPYHVFEKRTAEEILTSNGFTKVSDTLPAGEHHYAILFKK
jgi:ubiquinone/menaquinone biosynthesis C-methylase UbiE